MASPCGLTAGLWGSRILVRRGFGHLEAHTEPAIDEQAQRDVLDISIDTRLVLSHHALCRRVRTNGGDAAERLGEMREDR